MINDFNSITDPEQRMGSRRMLAIVGAVSLAATAALYGFSPAVEQSELGATAPDPAPLADTPQTEIKLTLPAYGDESAVAGTASQPADSDPASTRGTRLATIATLENDQPTASAGSFQLSVSDRPLEHPAMALTNDLELEPTIEPQILSVIETAEHILAETTREAPTDHSIVATDVSDKWIEEQVKKGDSLSRIFSRLGLSATLLHRIVNSSKEAKQLARIRPGQFLKVKLDLEGNLLALIHERSAIESLQVLPAGDSFETRIVERGLEKRVAQATGTITNSLYEGAQRAGLSDELIMELANIFGWDIDFALEIRAGDRFSLIYEEEYLDGKKYDNGPILAAEFINRGKVFRAIRYQDDQGDSNYFSADGRSMRKAFLRAPVDFRRISSRFTKARWHPVLGKKRPHRGVDYAAATGTPIKASGDGRVTFRGRKGGYGNTVIIKHGNQYTTLYAHLSRFNRKVKKGSRVQQGQVIGYVGKTGLATGPHLHYEFRVNGVHRNPLTVKIPAAAPIDKKYRQNFASKSAPLLKQLDLISTTILAEAN